MKSFVAAALFLASPAFAQGPSGKALYTARCASCRSGITHLRIGASVKLCRS